MICYLGFHSRRYPQGLMDTAEIVIHEMQGHGMFQILNPRLSVMLNVTP